jgi:hypothetical protein
MKAWFKEAIERRTISPFHLTSSPILSRISAVLQNDGATVHEAKLETFKTHRNKIVDAAARWDVFQEERAWDQARLEFSLTIADASPFSGIPCSYGLHALCKKTRWRKTEVSEFRSGAALLNLTIPKEDVAGEIIVSPFILHSGASGDGLDQSKGKRLAAGFPVSIVIDPPGERFGSGLELRWYAFPEDLRDSLYYLDLDAETPLLLINKRHAQLKTIFEDRSKTGPRHNIRNSAFSFIAVDVWMQLAQFAGEMARLQLDDDSDTKVVLGRKIMRSLGKMLQLREDDIMRASSDSAERSRLHRLLQNHFRLAAHQDALAFGLIEGSSS